MAQKKPIITVTSILTFYYQIYSTVLPKINQKIPGLLIRPIKIRQEVHISRSRITTKNQGFSFKQSKMVFVRILHLHYWIWGNKKRKHAKFSEKRTFFTPWYATYVCSFLLIYNLEYTSEFFYQSLGSRRQILRLFHNFYYDKVLHLYLRLVM